jgi:hypothetical protein
MRHWIAALTGILLAATTASADTFEFKRNGMTYSIAVPPPKWFAKPLLAEVVVYKESAEETLALCSLAIGTEERDACTFLLPDMCKIIINVELPWQMYAAVLHHETAHCHGWPGDHPTE